MPLHLSRFLRLSISDGVHQDECQRCTKSHPCASIVKFSCTYKSSIAQAMWQNRVEQTIYQRRSAKEIRYGTTRVYHKLVASQRGTSHIRGMAGLLQKWPRKSVVRPTPFATKSSEARFCSTTEDMRDTVL